MSTDPRSRSWVEVDPAALRRNLATIRGAAGVEVAPMVKADAYGVGLVRAVRALEAEAPWGYGVATVPEGMEVRRIGVERPILVLSPPPPGVVEEGILSRLTLSVSSIEGLRRIAAAAEGVDRQASIHLEVDTGMGRAGFRWDEVAQWGPVVREVTGGRVRWEGIFSHLHSADASEAEPVSLQAERLRDVVATLRGMGWEGGRLHLSNSAGALRRPELSFDLVRPGIFLYGGSAGTDLPEPEEVVQLRARVVLSREVPPGATLGYGATYRASRRERWATLGIGYGDGLPRALGNRGRALLRGRFVPIVGRISMDLTVVEVTDLPGGPVAEGEVATLIGSDGTLRNSVDEVAAQAGTVSYELLTGLMPRLPRVWIGDAESGADPRAPASRTEQGKIG